MVSFRAVIWNESCGSLAVFKTVTPSGSIEWHGLHGLVWLLPLFHGGFKKNKMLIDLFIQQIFIE